MSNIQKFSYHNHTNFSDGSNTLEEMVAQAKKIGFCELGISDHLIVHKNMMQNPSWNKLITLNASYIYNNSFKNILSKYQSHCEKIRKISARENIKLYVGFEVDFFTYNGWLDEFNEFIKQLDYDYLISGNHFFCNEDGSQIINIDSLKGKANNIPNLSEYIVRHFDTIKKSIESNLFTFLAHLDYVRKLGDYICGPKMYQQEKNQVLSALQNFNKGIEISTKGLRKIGDFYPCQEILQEIAKRNIKVVISDDAHSVNELGTDFAKAEAELLKHSITHRLKL